MTEKKRDETPAGLEEQIKEMLRKANLSFIMNPGEAQPASPAGTEETEAETESDPLKPIREFSLKPRDVRDYLDRFVIRQSEAKKVLSVAICDHYNHVRRCLEDDGFGDEEYAKHNLIFLGPTGVGKTYMMRCAAKLIGVPFVKADATKFSETGYVGHDVEDLVRDLVKAADGDVDLAQYGIIFLDEVDKIAAETSAGGKDVSGRGVQINLLKLMEETDVGLFSQTDLIGQMQAVMDLQRGREKGPRTISTRHILFIVSGAFGRLAAQVKQRVGQHQIGFGGSEGAEAAESDYLRQARTRDFIDYGFEPEFIGRLPVRVVCDALDKDDLAEIMLKSEGSILTQYRNDFEGYGIDLHIGDDAVRGIAERAAEEKTGARGLMTVLERVLRDFKFELPSTPIKSLEVTQRTLAEPRETLSEILKQKESVRRDALKEDLQRFAEAFREEHGVRLTFTRDAVEALVDLCLAQDKTVGGLCAERFRDLEYGVKLIARNTKRGSFSVTRKLVENPADELSRRVAQSFKKS